MIFQPRLKPILQSGLTCLEILNSSGPYVCHARSKHVYHQTTSNDIDDIIDDIVNDIHIMMNKKNAEGFLRRLVRRLHLKCPVRFFAQPKEERLPDLCIIHHQKTKKSTRTHHLNFRSAELSEKLNMLLIL